MFGSCQHVKWYLKSRNTKRVRRKKEPRTEPGGPPMFGNLDHEECPEKKTETVWLLHHEKGRRIVRAVEVFKLNF